MIERAADLRLAFDAAFGEPPQGRAEEPVDLLALRAGGAAYAVRLAEITGLFPSGATVGLPSLVPEFMGLAGLRHQVVPVYSLRSLLGHALAGAPPLWLIIARGAHPVAFAFEQFEGHLRVPPSAILPTRDGTAFAQGLATARLAGDKRGVLSIGALIATIEDRVRRFGTAKEQ